jgi:hypothetical protein
MTRVFHKTNDEGVHRDWVDLRDQIYQPNLSVLRESVQLDKRLAPVYAATGLNTPIFGVRNQQSSGRCVGYALANLIDIQRNLQMIRGQGVSPKDLEIVSADMLYWMARFHDRYTDREGTAQSNDEGVRSLRSAIKGFYHHGTCLDWPGDAPPGPERWQSTCYLASGGPQERHFPSVDQAKAARAIGLGAYYRIASVLNHFHAALNDAEAIVVSANIHDGWNQAVPQTEGQITWPPAWGKIGTHAFVITGYDEHGFHVLNSWGLEWGGYRGQAGIGLWRYADWAQNVIDAWVLRLGVSAPSAFGVSIGEKGTKGAIGTVQKGSTPCFELVGHYMHLDDGYHVASESYPSMTDGWTNTCRYLAERVDPNARPADTDAPIYRGILIWIPGSLEGIKPAFTDAVQRKNGVKALGCYPYTVFWCNSFMEKSLEVLDTLFDSCKKQAGEDAAHLDSLIEQRVQGVGRAFWRDIELGAQRALRGIGELPQEADDNCPGPLIEPGYVAQMLADIWALKQETGCEVHLVAEGAGALVVHEILSAIADDATRPKSERRFCRHDPENLFDTLHLVHPAIGLPRASQRLVPLISAMNGTVAGKRNRASRGPVPVVEPLIVSAAERRARIYIPTRRLEKAVRFGSYGKSILHLVSRAFEDRHLPPDPEHAQDQTRPRPPRQFLGMAELADDKDFPARGAIYRLNRVAAQLNYGDRVSQTAFSKDPTIPNSILHTIASRRGSD